MNERLNQVYICRSKGFALNTVILITNAIVKASYSNILKCANFSALLQSILKMIKNGLNNLFTNLISNDFSVLV
jgi:hypothetical protein